MAKLKYPSMKNIRYYAFWILDFLKGSPIRNHYNEIQSVFYDNNDVKRLQSKLLSNILEYAVTHTEYYNQFNPKSIESFPIVDKSDIISNMDNMFSKEFKDIKDTLRTMSTSGSSGTPFKIYQDANKVLRNKADLLFFYKLGGYNIGDRMYSLRIWNEINEKSNKDQFKENFRMFDTSNLDVEGANRFVRDMTEDKNMKVILAYASSFTALMDNLEVADDIDWRIKTIITGSEHLPKRVKYKMQEVFNCSVISRYANQENGLIAQQPATGEDYYELNNGSYYIEFLKMYSNEPADEFEEGRIVITDLFNKAVPMIRYDTGDIGVYSHIIDKVGNKRKILNSISGRKIDYLYSNQKQKLSPHVFTNLMWKYNSIKQFQLIQEDFNVITLKLVYKENEKDDILERELSEDIKHLFGHETKLSIINLENIPLEASGKRKYIISNIKQNV